MAGNYWAPPGLGHVGAYQVSGVPWLSGSLTLNANAEHKYKFPYVTQNITVINHSSRTIRVHFASKDSSGGGPITGLHYIELDSDEDSFSMSVKCTKLYVSTPNDSGIVGEYRVVASLTNIPSGSMADNALTGSGITDIDAS
tara:strand:+ start:566 stop:991 length:426 start_codon:yes stop_codon:yes gene_type:complete